ncbi:hypothetical protein BDW02DRAFT_634691 [Decorospora gaudefroyi]|uniref:Zn(2)-C6 fungal-type domain-containing protein n=1 Tax=Decorospora gaudefroyi TaxID=184978 RepID=A0A6A5JY85_9PLEO|nr:hypothetical protein BDW02DRAFT_634691 [Decorospora gaudefroyi]
MAPKTIRFVPKKAHHKSRGGCLTCKRKKVKCDETQPACGYCSLRNIHCAYNQDLPSTSKSLPSSSSSPGLSPNVTVSPAPDANLSTSLIKATDFNSSSLQTSLWLMPASHTAIGTFTPLDHSMLHHYRTNIWRILAVCDDALIQTVHMDIIPQLSVSHPFLLYALLSITATQFNNLNPSGEVEKRALVYRQRTFQSYTQALQNITANNYEAIVATGTLLLALVPAPPSSGNDEEYLDWMLSLLKLSDGLRILAGLRWDQGIEKLSIYPLVCRELRTLPPPPVVQGLDAPIGRLGTTPINPNPAPTYMAQQLQPTYLFLPPPLMELLNSTCSSTGPDPYPHRLIPVFQALSPIFLSLYYYHLNPDFYVRLRVFPSFLMPDFLQLVKEQEPRALVLIAWWFALAGLIPRGWWSGSSVNGVIAAIGRKLRKRDHGDGGLAVRVFAGAVSIVDAAEKKGKEGAAKGVFEGWFGVQWEEGPRRAAQWEVGLWSDLGDVDGNLDFIFNSGAGLSLGFDSLGLDTSI